MVADGVVAEPPQAFGQLLRLFMGEVVGAEAEIDAVETLRHARQFFEFEMRAVGANPAVFSRRAVGEFEDSEIKSGTGLDAEARVQNGPVVIRFQHNRFHCSDFHAGVPFQRHGELEAFSAWPWLALRHLGADSDFHAAAPLAVVLNHDVGVAFQCGGKDAVRREEFERLAVGVCDHDVFERHGEGRLFLVAELEGDLCGIDGIEIEIDMEGIEDDVFLRREGVVEFQRTVRKQRADEIHGDGLAGSRSRRVGFANGFGILVIAETAEIPVGSREAGGDGAEDMRLRADFAAAVLVGPVGHGGGGHRADGHCA